MHAIRYRTSRIPSLRHTARHVIAARTLLLEARHLLHHQAPGFIVVTLRDRAADQATIAASHAGRRARTAGRWVARHVTGPADRIRERVGVCPGERAEERRVAAEAEAFVRKVAE